MSAAIIVRIDVTSRLPWARPTMPVASLSPSPVIDTTPTTIPTTAHASATGIAP